MTSIPRDWIGWSPLLSRWNEHIRSSIRELYRQHWGQAGSITFWPLLSSIIISSSSSLSTSYSFSFTLSGKHQGRWPYKVLAWSGTKHNATSPKGESGVIALTLLLSDLRAHVLLFSLFSFVSTAIVLFAVRISFVIFNNANRFAWRSPAWRAGDPTQGPTAKQQGKQHAHSYPKKIERQGGMNGEEEKRKATCI